MTAVAMLVMQHATRLLLVPQQIVATVRSPVFCELRFVDDGRPKDEWNDVKHVCKDVAPDKAA